MDRQDIEVLHQKASEHYLEGDYLAALEMWQALRTQSPDDERALEGIRLCEMMSPEFTEVNPSELRSEFAPDQDLDFDLDTSILEEMDDPSGENDVTSALEDEVEDVIQSLDAMSAVQGPEAGSADGFQIDAAAASELKKRQDELFSQAKVAADAGDVDEARSALARLFLLAENHEGARALEAEIDEKSSQDAHEIEDKLAEAVQWMEQGRLEEAESNLRRVLDLSPDHKEAEHFLEKTLLLMEQQDEEQGSGPAAAGDDLLLGNLDPGEAAMSHGAVDLEMGASENISIANSASAPAAGQPVDTDSGPPDLPPGSAVPDMTDNSEEGVMSNSRNKVALGVILFAVLLVAGWYLGKDMFGGSSESEVAAAKPADTSLEQTSTLDGRSTQDLLEQAEELSATQSTMVVPEASDLAALVEEAEALMENHMFGNAVLAWNKVLEIDPSNSMALRRIEAAGRGYRDEQRRLEDLRKAEMLFEEGDYNSSLKILYRLPDDIRPERVQRYKVNGWYNLGGIALKAGRINLSLGHFNEIRTIAPDDERALELREFAVVYQSREKDRAFYNRVNDLQFRELERGL